MTELEAALRQLVADLHEVGASFALVGGLAVSIRSEPRLTRDADMAVSVRDDSEAEGLVQQMTTLGYRPQTTIEHEITKRLAAVRLAHDERPAIVVDLLFASCGIEPEIVEHAEELEVLAGLVAPVARPGDLIAMKLLARDDRSRPADYDDLVSLIAIADASDLEAAREAVGLITAREYNRDRDLLSDLESLLRFDE